MFESFKKEKNARIINELNVRLTNDVKQCGLLIGKYTKLNRNGKSHERCFLSLIRSIWKIRLGWIRRYLRLNARYELRY